MVEVYSPALEETITVNRIINRIDGGSKGPTVVFFAGIHGNETAGVFALEKELKKLEGQKKDVKGTIYGISGNLRALKAGKRFISEDLNRIWTKDRLNQLNNQNNHELEEKEQAELFKILTDILKTEQGPFYFIDFHTTSSKTIPFITINDAIINRRFSKLFPVPIVLGIEEYLNGPLLSYINELGYVSLGFESGQHDEIEAIKDSVAFIHLALLFAGCTIHSNFPEQSIYYDQLKNASKNMADIFEVIDLYGISEVDDFKMQPELKSFQEIEKGLFLATNNKERIYSAYNARLFMPLYQNQGSEGFFVIRKIKPFYLKISAIMRNWKMDGLLVLLPGINWEDESRKTLIANLRIVKFLAKPIFHLLGYRNRQLTEDKIRLHNRERASKLDMYRNEFWFKNKE
ncbi:MAG: succinylglutamate desuccinylase/aspartoacylase family protein [Bacteroidia bacterium]|nr:succinylglutamate desuccinylase/aspartoacylase family protein [Bacteroidia bacterium]NND10381.1 aspartoacylase [Flavobacteriaceae bacterium]MBT8308978.1 succinylglutamate desuccinylase/aspartoacylase family protein [Bacteroidia bacterium]NNK27933.1 aspartoacylase [Flavobacteriaceae bacterium]NNL60805.1 aspartoacylase [Flavobacteriaceae bacterium]